MGDTRRTKAGHGFWQVTGIGELRWTVLGTVEKVYGGWFAVAQDEETRSCNTLSEGQEWLLEQYGRYAARIITLQPAAHVDQITDDGTELTKLPYPFHVNAAGEIQRQEFWNGNPERVIGFVSDLHRQEVDLDWDVVFRDPQRAVGQYVITQDKSGTWATHTLAIWKASEV